MPHDYLIALSREYTDATRRYGILILMTYHVIMSIGHCNITLKQGYNHASIPWWNTLFLHCHTKSIGILMNPERFVFSCLLFLFPLIIRFKQAIIALQEGRAMRGAQILFSLRCLLPPSRRSSRPRHRGGESRMHSRDPVRLREGSAWNPGTNSPSEKFFPAESLVSSCSSGPLGRRIHQPYVAPNIIPYSVFLIF